MEGGHCYGSYRYWKQLTGAKVGLFGCLCVWYQISETIASSRALKFYNLFPLLRLYSLVTFRSFHHQCDTYLLQSECQLCDCCAFIKWETLPCLHWRHCFFHWTRCFSAFIPLGNSCWSPLDGGGGLSDVRKLILLQALIRLIKNF